MATGRAYIQAFLLGSAQDAGIPQIGCRCARCVRARNQPDAVRLPAALGMVDHVAQVYWLIDATPAVSTQLGFLQNRYPRYVFQGVLLTHAHMGHYTGLVQFGKEAWNSKRIDLHLSKDMLEFLSGNAPWSDLVFEHFQARVFSSQGEITLSRGLTVRPIEVPHRREYSDTHAFLLLTGGRRLFYCPDIDSWEGFPLKGLLMEGDIALLDGTFFSAGEVSGRRIVDVPHPPVRQTVKAVRHLSAEVYLIHLNHTNPLNDAGDERDRLAAKGVAVAEPFQSWVLHWR